MSYLNVSLFFKLIYSACVRVCRCECSQALFFCHFILILLVNSNERSVTQMENTLTHTKKKTLGKKEGKKTQTGRQKKFISTSYICIVSSLLKSPFCFAFFWWWWWWHSLKLLLKARVFDCLPFYIIHSNNTPNYLLKLPLYRHFVCWHFSHETQMLKIIWR